MTLLTGEGESDLARLGRGAVGNPQKAINDLPKAINKIFGVFNLISE